ncbi:porin family protein [Carboxylicivirga sp. RSCT41]|uniref:porin family protein n=1 Tax=Carboxylicivirga agarovorans TaxID=3417570 RepID=UPI003D327516
MNKTLLTLLIFLFLHCLSYAQDETKRLKIVSIHAGPAMSSFINAEAPHKTFIFSEDYTIPAINPESLEHDYDVNMWRDARLNLVAGISFEYFIKERLSVAASLNYEGKGIHIEDTNTDVLTQDTYTQVHKSAYDIEINNQYLTLPVFARWYFGGSNLFYVQGGMYMGYLLKSEIDINILEGVASNYYSDGSPTLTNADEINVMEMHVYGEDEDKDYTNNFDVGLNLGGGLNYPLGEHFYLNVDLSVCLGLIQLDKKNDNDYEVTPLPWGSGYTTMVRSANYYGLNSKAKNISGALTVGIGVKL